MLHKQFIIDVHGNNPTELNAAQAEAGQVLGTRDVSNYAGSSRFLIRRRERVVVRYPERARAAKRRWLVLALLVAVVEVGACAWLATRSTAPAPAPQPRIAVGGDIGAVLGATASVGTRRVYPFSVVPGGVTSQAELARAVQSDRVVAQHYSDLDVHAAQPIQAKAREAYVSYRRDDQIFWTRHKVKLKEGELILSDGQHEIRGRCGNRISDVARMPVADIDPPHDLLDAYTEVPLVVVVPEPKPASKLQTCIAQQLHGDVPEPGTLWLMAAGLSGLLVLSRRRRRRRAAPDTE
jgi:hypothetical protein